MKKYFNVSFQYSETVFCSNIALAESVADVEKHYRKYNWISVTEAKEQEVETAKKKGMPIINIDHETEPTEETAEAEQTEQQPEQAAETEEQAATTASQGTERKEIKAMFEYRFTFTCIDNGGFRQCFTVRATDKKEAITKGLAKARRNAKGDLNNWDCRMQPTFR